MSKYLIAVISSGLLTNTVLAGDMGSVASKTWVASLSAGPAWANQSNNQLLFLTPSIEKYYESSNSTSTLFDGEFFLGIQQTLSQAWQGQLGIAVAATSQADLSGLIWDDADPEFINYQYDYKLQHTHLALKGKLLLDKGFSFLPWVSASVGVGFNRAYSYTNTPLIFEASPNSNFTSNTETSFTYTVGLGVQKVLSNHWQAGIGYEFADWGKNRLGAAYDQTSGAGLSSNNFYTNGLLFNITYTA